jgi:hypothetical protein
MRYIAVIVAVVALGWFGFKRYVARAEANIDAASRAEADASSVKSVVTPAPVSTPAPLAPVVSSSAAPVARPMAAAESAPAAPTAAPSAPIKIDLTQALGPNNHYHDAHVGLSVTLPAGWTVRDAIRWGENHTQNTVFLRPEPRTTASPSMYYKPYTPEEAASISSRGAGALLREQAEKKEISRAAGGSDYRNVPDSFAFFDVNGSPAMSYFATFTRGDQVMTEHFIRVLGPRGYVMFFTPGKFEDVQAIMPQLKQAASTVRGP